MLTLKLSEPRDCSMTHVLEYIYIILYILFFVYNTQLILFKTVSISRHMGGRVMFDIGNTSNTYMTRKRKAVTILAFSNELFLNGNDV